jgi:hypothetical protein
VRVFLSKAIASDFASQAMQDKFVAAFKAWKNADDPCSKQTFGKNVTTKVPIGHDFDHLWHVHLLPEDEEARERWWVKFMSKTDNLRCNRESDTLLYYAQYKDAFLLLRRTSHDLMRAHNLEAVCTIADKWVSHLKNLAG